MNIKYYDSGAVAAAELLGKADAVLTETANKFVIIRDAAGFQCVLGSAAFSVCDFVFMNAAILHSIGSFALICSACYHNHSCIILPEKTIAASMNISHICRNQPHRSPVTPPKSRYDVNL